MVRLFNFASIAKKGFHTHYYHHHLHYTTSPPCWIFSRYFSGIWEEEEFLILMLILLALFEPGLMFQFAIFSPDLEVVIDYIFLCYEKWAVLWLFEKLIFTTLEESFSTTTKKWKYTGRQESFVKIKPHAIWSTSCVTH